MATVNAVLLASGDRTLEAALPQNNSINRLQGSISSQSDDIKSIRNSTTAEVQVLKNIAQGFQITSSQIMFTTLTVATICSGIASPTKAACAFTIDIHK